MTARLMEPRTVGPADPPERLPLPAAVDRRRIVWRYAIPVIGYHLIALLAFLPWFFSWTGVVLVFLGAYVFGMLGINLCYHRLLAHRGFSCPKWFEHTLAFLGICCLQDTPARWVAVHRRHHQHADEQEDPHSPLVNFFWGHVGWLLVENTDLIRRGVYERYAKDLLRDPFYMKCERTFAHDWIVLLCWVVFFLGGFIAELLMGGTVTAAVQFGSSVLLWGVVVRTVVVWHITWSVNSATHLWGYRNYRTDENSRNNTLVAILTSGEGWHNNHHADPRSSKHGHYPGELDVVFLAIRVLEKIGLVRDVVMPNPRIAAARATSRLATRDFDVAPHR
jgi:fatty-acid desaturase